MYPDPTRTPHVTSNQTYQVESIASGLQNAWGMAFPPSGNMLVMHDVGLDQDLLRNRCKRILDMHQGPDGVLYVLTDDANGEILLISPG